MAELPDLGKHCFLENCKKLDFTPFFCSLCSNHYCSDHRFHHGCDASRVYDGTSSSSEATPLRPYLCSKEGCFTAESIKVTCPFCLLNFCLGHRFAVDHNCTEIPEEKRRQEVEQKIAAVREALGSALQKQEAPKPTSSTQNPSKKVVSEAEQKKLDRVALMKLKLADKSGLGPNEKLIIFVEWPEGRLPVVVSKSWTVGKGVDTARKALNISSSVTAVAKKGTEDSVDFSDKLGSIFAEHDTIILSV